MIAGLESLLDRDDLAPGHEDSHFCLAGLRVFAVGRFLTIRILRASRLMSQDQALLLL
jgi:hypothetical protein